VSADAVRGAVIVQRLDKLEEAIAQLEAMVRRGIDAIAADPVLTAALERFLEVAVQSAIDAGSRLVAERRWRGVETYAAVFVRLGEQEILGEELARRLVHAAGLRNRLAHHYLDVETAQLVALLPGAIDDLRAFVTAMYRAIGGA